MALNLAQRPSGTQDRMDQISQPPDGSRFANTPVLHRF